LLKAEIISIGTELLLGEITDTNASYLASQLPLLGIDLYWISQVGDNQTRLVEVLKRAWQRSELILTTGGLGPTADDITRESIAELFGEKMEVVPSLEQALRKRFGQMAINMPLSNLKQATAIPSAEPIPNEMGTAPGWWVERDGHIIVAMPGPPRELYNIWAKMVRPRLVEKSDSILLPRTFKTVGLSEAAVAEMVTPLLSSANPTLGVYAKTDGIYLRLAAKAKAKEQAEKMIAEGEASIKAVLNDYIWGIDDDSMETVVGNMLEERGLTLAFMEDSSGGLLAAAFSDIAEGSSFFKGGLIACTDDAKVALGVGEEVISKYGAVSPEVAQAMAEAARKLLKADIGVSTTGVEVTEERPMGTTYIGVADSSGSRAVGRPMRKQHVTSTALFELRRLLLSLD
jgi:nicotinamide-nucleotide amidase